MKTTKKANTSTLSEIRYAAQLQTSLMQSEQEFKKLFPNSFILIQSRKMIGGDFFWFSEIGNKIVLVAGDCTGHGVSAALISMVAVTLLNDLVNVKGVLDPKKIIFELNKSFKTHDDKTKKNWGDSDGLDISVCLIDKHKKRMMFSGANQYVYISNGKNLLILQGEEYSVGDKYFNLSRFKSSKVKIEKGYMLYLITDGYADQLGGKYFKRMGTAKFREIIQDNQRSSMKVQKQKIEQELKKWKGKNETTDDVLVLGIKF